MKKIIWILLVMAAATGASAENWVSVKADSAQQYGVIYVPAKICGVKFSKMIVDTGASLVTLPYADYVYMKKTGMLNEAKFVKNSTVKTPLGSSAGKIYEFKTFEIAGVQLSNVWIMFSTTPNSTPQRIIGQNVFRRFKKLCVDWSTDTVWLSK